MSARRLPDPLALAVVVIAVLAVILAVVLVRGRARLRDLDAPVAPGADAEGWARMTLEVWLEANVAEDFLKVARYSTTSTIEPYVAEGYPVADAYAAFALVQQKQPLRIVAFDPIPKGERVSETEYAFEVTQRVRDRKTDATRTITDRYHVVRESSSDWAVDMTRTEPATAPR